VEEILAAQCKSDQTILLILDGIKQGGIQQYYFLLIKEYCKQFNKVSLVVLEQTESDLQVPTFTNLEILQLNAKSFYDLKTLYQIYKYFRRISPDFIIASIYRSQIWSSIVKMRNSKLIWVENNTYLYRTFTQWKIMRIMAKRVYKVVCISQEVKNITDKNINVKSEIVYCPISIPKDSKFKMPHSNDFIFIGRLIEQKNPELLLESFAYYCKHFDTNSVMHIVGEGFLLRNLEMQAQELGIKGKCKFHSDLNGEPKWKLLLRAKTLVSTSKFEGFGIVRFEALSHGRCLVTTNTGGSELLINKEHLGVFIVPNTPNNIAKAMFESINRKYWYSNILEERVQIIKNLKSEVVSQLLLK